MKKSNKALGFLSTSAVATMIATTLASTTAFAAVDAYQIKTADGSILEYNKADLTQSFLSYKRGQAAPLFSDFNTKLTAGAQFYSFHDDKNGYVDYSAIKTSYLANRTSFKVDDFTATSTSKATLTTYKLVAVGTDGTVTTTDKSVGTTTPTVTGPVVTNTTPAEGKDVSSDDIFVTFKSAINVATFNTTNVKLYNVTTGTYEPITVNTADPKILQITAVNGLNGNLSQWRLTIQNVEDLSGQKMSAPFVLNFVDGTAAGLAANAGIDGGLSVWGRRTAYQSNAAFTYEADFDHDMDITTINKDNVTLVNSSTNEAADYNVAINGRRLVITLNKDLDENADYALTIKSTVKTSAGIPMASDIVRRFHTRDLTAPSVVSVTPADGTSGVSTAPTFEITFSEPVSGLALDAADGFNSAQPDTIALKNNSNITWVDLVANWSLSAKPGSDNKVWTLKPSVSLASDSSYTLTVRGKKTSYANGIKDTSTSPYNELANDYTVNFTTGRADSTAPTIKVSKLIDTTYTPNTMSDTTSGIKNVDPTCTKLYFVFDDQLTTSGSNLPAGAAILKDLATGATSDVSASFTVVNNSGANTATATIDLSTAGLGTDKNYELTFTTSLKDDASNGLASPYKFQFTTMDGVDALIAKAALEQTTASSIITQSYAFTADTVADNVYSTGDTITSLKDGQGVLPDAPFVLKFRDDMLGLDQAGAITLSYVDANGAKVVVPCTITLSGTRTAKVTPNAALLDNTVYTVTISGDVTDEVGNNAWGGDQTISFKTATNYKPSVTFGNVAKYNPLTDNAVRRDTSITLTFNGDVLADTTTNGALNLSNYKLGTFTDSASGSLADGYIQWSEVTQTTTFSAVVDSTNRVVTIYPDAPLSAATTYYLVANDTLSVGGTSLDAYPQAYKNAKYVSFKTKTTAQSVAPTATTGLETAVWDAAAKTLTLTYDRPIDTACSLTTASAFNITGGSFGTTVGNPIVQDNKIIFVLTADDVAIVPGVTKIQDASTGTGTSVPHTLDYAGAALAFSANNQVTVTK